MCVCGSITNALLRLTSSPATVVTGMAYIGSLVPCNEINAIMILLSKWHANFLHIRKKLLFFFFYKTASPVMHVNSLRKYGS